MIPSEDELPEQPGRPSVEEKHDYYFHGDGFRRAVAEAKSLLDVGAPLEEVIEATGLSAQVLLRALPAEYSSARSSRPEETAA